MLIKLSLQATPVHAGDWQPVAANKAEKIYHRDVDNSSIPMVMITATFRAVPARVHAVITDYDRFAEFIPHVRESRVLLREAPDQWVFHHLRFPGPLADRAYVIKSTDIRNAGSDAYRVEWRLAQRHFPNADLDAGIRPKAFSGFWTLRAAPEGGMTEARYAVHSDPGGMIPAWLVKTMTHRYVRQVVAAVRARLPRK